MNLPQPSTNPADETDEECPYDCPDCGNKLTEIKGSWGCLCLWGGRYPTPPMIEEFAI